MELIRLLADHPRVRLVWAGARTGAGRPLEELLPHLTGTETGRLPIADAEEIFRREAADGGGGTGESTDEIIGTIPPMELVFLALPHGAAMAAAAEFRRRGAKVIDLSADLRLHDGDVHRHWYGEGDPSAAGSAGGDHGTGLRSEAVYGLPELFRDEVAGADLVANPGCYPTVTALAAAPALAAGIADPGGIIADCKSGLSGAGKSPGPVTHFSEANENTSAYAVGGVHRHTPEIEQSLTAVAGRAASVTFTPHLVPMTRGILATVYMRPARGPVPGDGGGGGPSTAGPGNRRHPPLEDILKIYNEFYAGHPFVKVLPAGVTPKTKHVLGSNYCHIGLAVDERTGTIIAVAAIDNLVKGASGQAVQNMNIMMGWDESAGIGALPMYP